MDALSIGVIAFTVILIVGGILLSKYADKSGKKKE